MKICSNHTAQSNMLAIHVGALYLHCTLSDCAVVWPGCACVYTTLACVNTYTSWPSKIGVMMVCDKMCMERYIN